MRGTLRVALVAASMVTMLSGAPARAVVSVGTGPCGYGQTCAGHFHGPVADGGVAECMAYTPYPVVWTSVQCYVVGSNGDVHHTINVISNGQVSTLRRVFLPGELTSPTYQLCVSAGYYTTWPPHGATSGVYRCMTTV